VAVRLVTSAGEKILIEGNRSAIHWDLVLIQTPEWGGGEIWFDGVLERKDGRFVLPSWRG
jgi:aminopeptidase